MRCEVLFATAHDAITAMRALGGSEWFYKRPVPGPHGLTVRPWPWSESIMFKASKRLWVSDVPLSTDPLQAHTSISDAIGSTFEGKWGYQKEGPTTRVMFFEFPTAEEVSLVAHAMKHRRIVGLDITSVNWSINTGDEIMNRTRANWAAPPPSIPQSPHMAPPPIEPIPHRSPPTLVHASQPWPSPPTMVPAMQHPAMVPQYFFVPAGPQSIAPQGYAAPGNPVVFVQGSYYPTRGPPPQLYFPTASGPASNALGTPPQ